MYNPFKRPTANVSVMKCNNNSGFGAKLTGFMKHDLRLDEESAAPMHPEMTRQNEVLVEPKKYPYETPEGEYIYNSEGEQQEGYDFTRMVEERFKEKNIHPRKESVNAAEIVVEITGGWNNLKGWENLDMEAWSRGEIDLKKFSREKAKEGGFDYEKWVKDSVKFMEKKFGKDNILSATVHNDEFTPHIHFLVTPITDDGRLCMRDWFHAYTDYNKVKLDYYEAVQQGDAFSKIRENSRMPFDTQRKAQQALEQAGEVELDIERLPNETDRAYQDRVKESVSVFSMQKHLETEDTYRRMADENIRLTQERQQAEEEKEKAKKEAQHYKEQAEEAKKREKFAMEYMTGQGLTYSQVVHTEEAISKINEEHEAQVRLLNNTVTTLRNENDELKGKVQMLSDVSRKQQLTIDSYKDIIEGNGLNETAVKQLRNTRYMLYGLAHGFPDAEKAKSYITSIARFGKNLMDKEEALEHEQDNI